jgi:hypothetical protein
MKKFLKFFLFILFFVSCSKKFINPSDEQKKILNERVKNVHTIVGRVHFTGILENEKFSFPADIVIALNDKTVDGNFFRLGAEGPLGVTHVLMILKKNILKIYDFQNNKLNLIENTWENLPISLLPSFFAGILNEQDLSKLQFKLFFSAHHECDLVLSELQGFLDYKIYFSNFSNPENFCLPRQIEIKAEKLYLRIDWLERKFNQLLSAEIYNEPKVFFEKGQTSQ